MVRPAFVTIVGSTLYGTNTSVSDTDFKGFGFAELDEIVGLKAFEQQEYTNNAPDGPTKVEGIIYDVRRIVRLLAGKGNPTVLEPCCADPKFHILDTDVGKYVREYVRSNLITKHLFVPYSAYHRAQVRKLQSMERTGKRAEAVKEVGFDAKFASHAYRLAKQCVEIMQTGMLSPTMTGETLEMCRDIRAAKYDKDQTLAILEDVDKQMHAAYKISTIRETVDFNQVNMWLSQLYSDYIVWHRTGQDHKMMFDSLIDSKDKCEILTKVSEKISNDQNA